MAFRALTFRPSLSPIGNGTRNLVLGIPRIPGPTGTGEAGGRRFSASGELMSTGFGFTPARLAWLALCAIFALSFFAPRVHAQTVEPQRWVRTTTQDAPKAPDAALADKVRTRAVRVIARLREETTAPAGIAAAQAIAGSQDRIARQIGRAHV